MRKIIIRDLKNIKRYLTGGEKIITISFGIIISGFLFSNNAFATTMDANVNIRPSMALSVSTNDITLNLNPATKPFDTKDLTITIGTNNPTGYWLTMSSVSGTSDLVNTSDNTKTIPTITTAGSYTSANFPVNSWGYKIDSNDYIPFVSNTTIKSSNTIANDDTVTVNLASKIDYLQSSGTYNTTLSFKALPNVTQYTMQELGQDATLASQVCTEDPAIVMDARDNRFYAIAELKDGNCWMVQNLRLGQDTTTLALTTIDSDVQSGGFTLKGKLSDGKFTYTTVSGEIYQNNNSQYYCTTDYGCYYNWYTSTAGAGTTSVSSGNVDYSICPNGWTLPTQAQFATLRTAYNNSATSILVSPTDLKENANGVSTPGLLLGGFYNSSGASDIGSIGYYWSRTAYSAPTGDFLSLTTSSVNPAARSYKYLGLAVRCLLK